MRIHLDPGTSTLRLDDAGFAALVDATSGYDSDQGPEQAEVDAVLSDPAYAAAMRAVNQPMVRVRVDVAGRARTQTHLAWVDLDTAALLLTVHDDELQLLATAPQHLAAAVARVVRLGPRKVGEREPVAVEADLLEDLFHADDLRRLSAMTLVGADLAWTLAVGWPGGERLMSVVDGPTGLHLVEPADECWQLTPVTATLLWRRLTALLPDDDEAAVGA